MSLCVSVYACFSASAFASSCSPDGIAGRTIVVDPTEHPLIGTMQYAETLPLADHEVVLTFDDGPSPRYTDRVLGALADACVKATFFMVGEMAKTFPAEAEKVWSEGHTIGTHSFAHPFTFGHMTEAAAGEEIDRGIDAVGHALDDPARLAPFFRVPGFLTSKATEAALAARGLMTWSADFPADDWLGISSAEIVRRALSRIEARGRGVLLLHDIHGRTAVALPEILRELGARGFKIVHVVAASPTLAKTVTDPSQWRPFGQVHPTAVAALQPDAAGVTDPHQADEHPAASGSANPAQRTATIGHHGRAKPKRVAGSRRAKPRKDARRHRPGPHHADRSRGTALR